MCDATVEMSVHVEWWCWHKQLWLVTGTICLLCVVDKLDQPSTADQLPSCSNEVVEMEDVMSDIESESEDESMDENDDVYNPQHDMEADDGSSESTSDDELDEESE